MGIIFSSLLGAELMSFDDNVASIHVSQFQVYPLSRVSSPKCLNIILSQLINRVSVCGNGTGLWIEHAWVLLEQSMLISDLLFMVELSSSSSDSLIN
jgi:hypothetical protein